MSNLTPNGDIKCLERITVDVDVETPPFSVLQFNVLASCNATSEAFPRVPARFLDLANRGPALMSEIFGFMPTFICLEEVDAPIMELLLRSKRPHYEMLSSKCGEWSVVMLHDTRAFTRTGFSLVPHGENGPHRRATLICDFKAVRGCQELTVAVTHLKSKAEFGQGRLEEAELVCSALAKCTTGNIVLAGDFNCARGSDAIGRFKMQGLRISNVKEDAFTTYKYKAGREQIREIDFIMYSRGLKPIRNLSMPTLSKIKKMSKLPGDEEQVGLPSCCYPSDHLAVGASFAFT